MPELKRYLQKLLDIIPTENYTTIENLAEQMKLSKRTISTRIQELNAALKNQGAFIETKPRYGVRLRVENLAQFNADKQNPDLEIPDSIEERVEFVISYLLKNDAYVKSDDLCDLIFISRGTLSAVLKRAEKWFNGYDISLERRPNYGIRIVGEEYNFRKCIVAAILNLKTFSTQNMRGEMENLRELTLEILNAPTDFMIRLSEVAIENFVVHVYVSLKRIALGKNIEFAVAQMPQIYNHEWRFIDRLADSLEEKFTTIFSRSERKDLALQLAGLRMLGNAEEDESNVVISLEIEQLAAEMLALVKIQFGYDFTNILAVHMQLCQHLISFDIRIKFGIQLQNPMLQAIKKQYMLGYQMASIAATVLSKKYGKEISDDEIGYFAVIFAYATDKYQSDVEKKSILIVCGSGKGSSRLLKLHYEQIFGEYLENVYVCDLQNLSAFDFKKADYIFTTVDIKKPLPLPIMRVDIFLNDGDKERVRHILRIGQNDFLRKYYRQEFFATDIQGADRETVIREICARIMTLYPLPHNFIDLVLQREQLGATDYGNFVAIPHPLKVVTKESFVFSAVLDKPILWSKYEVQVVFLLVVGEQEDDDIQKFYELTTKFITDKKIVKRLIQQKNYASLLSLYHFEFCRFKL